MNEPLEKLIRETLQAEKPPELSPFFAARVVNQIRIQKQPRRSTKLIFLALWCFGSFFVFSSLTNVVWSAWLVLAVLLLVPVSFVLTIFLEIND